MFCLCALDLTLWLALDAILSVVIAASGWASECSCGLCTLTGTQTRDWLQHPPDLALCLLCLLLFKLLLLLLFKLLLFKLFKFVKLLSFDSWLFIFERRGPAERSSERFCCRGCYFLHSFWMKVKDWPGLSKRTSTRARRYDPSLKSSSKLVTSFPLAARTLLSHSVRVWTSCKKSSSVVVSS